MEFRDYIIALALIVSVVSLVISWRTSGFNSKVKNAELRTQVLSKFGELKNTARSINYLVRDLAEDTESSNLPRVTAIVSDQKRLIDIADQIEEMYKNLSDSAHAGRGLEAYESTYYRLTDLFTQMNDLKADIEQIHKKVISDK